MTIGVEHSWRDFETEGFSSAIPQIANTTVKGDFGTLSLRGWLALDPGVRRWWTSRRTSLVPALLLAQILSPKAPSCPR